jgi:hypothetical protein
LETAFELFIDKKFITIFSMLFGFGFYIQYTHAEKRNVDFRPYFIKRWYCCSSSVPYTPMCWKNFSYKNRGIRSSRFKVQGSRFKVVHGHYLAAPPSMVRHIPLTKEASSEARYR